MKRAKLIKTALISGVTLAILNSCGGGGSNPLSWLLDKEWQGVEKIDSVNNQDALLGNLAVNKNGDIALIYRQDISPTQHKVWLSKYDGDNWSTPDNSVKPNNTAAMSPTVLIDDDKNIMSTWLEKHTSGHYIPKTRFYTNSWLSVENISCNTNTSYPVRLAANNQKIVAVWVQIVGGKTTVIARVYDKTTHHWSSYQYLSSTTKYSLLPQVSIDSNNKVIIVWLQKNSGSSPYHVYTRAYQINSANHLIAVTPSHAVDNVSFSAWGPSVASDSSGNSIVTWKQKDSIGGAESVFAIKFDGTNWDPQPTLLESSNNMARAPYLAYNKASNEFVAIWAQRNSDNKYVIHTNTYSGGSWQGVEVVEEASNATESRDPKIAFDSDGNAVAIWRKKNSSHKFDLVAKSYDGSDWGDKEVIDNLNDDVDHPYISFDGDDDAVVIWKQKDGSGKYHIFTNTLE